MRLRPLPRAAGRLAGLVVAVALLALSAAPVAAGRPAGTPTLSFKRILSGYDRPILVTHDGSPKQRLFIVEQTGRIRIARFVDGRWKKAGVFLDLSRSVLAPPVGGSEQGLLGLAFAPDYATSGRFYVDYTRRGSSAKRGDTVIAEYRRTSALVADATSGRTLLVVGQPYANHNGGHLAFGPDGLLYIGLGDGGDSGDPEDRAQDLTERLGKILRIDPHDPDGSGPSRFTVPADNPWIGETEKNLVWLSGARNPWRFSFDRTTGDLVIADVGQDRYEEIDWLPATGGQNAGKGLNLGWNVCEGARTYPDDDPCPQVSEGFTAPVFTYAHDGGAPMEGGCSVVGGYVIRAPAAAAWQGLYLFGDFCSTRIGVMDSSGDVRLTKNLGAHITSFGEDKARRLYVMDVEGDIWRINFSATGP